MLNNLSHIDIVFDGPPGPTAGRFVEVEDADGASISYGEWIERNGYHVLRLPGEWPRCPDCKRLFAFDPEEPFAYCECGTTEWGSKGRPSFAGELVPVWWWRLAPLHIDLNYDLEVCPRCAETHKDLGWSFLRGGGFDFDAEYNAWTLCPTHMEPILAIFDKQKAAGKPK